MQVFYIVLLVLYVLLAVSHPVRYMRLRARNPSRHDTATNDKFLNTRFGRWIQLMLIAITATTLISSCTIRPENKQTAGSGHKVVVIVVDSLTDRSLQQIIRRTDFPAFRYFLRHGQYVSDLVATFPSMTVSDLGSVITGAFPQDHRIPGLVWIDASRKEVVNYGNNLRQAWKVGFRSVAENTLYNLNQSQLSPKVRTIFEELQDAGYRTGAINMFIYRGRTWHRFALPPLLRFFFHIRSNPIKGPDVLFLGDLVEQGSAVHTKGGPFRRLGIQDDDSVSALIDLSKRNQLPDFTMVYLPDNDRYVHKYGVNQIKGLRKVEKNLEKILDMFGPWDQTLRHLTIAVMGDSGVTPVWPSQQHPTILLKDLFKGYSIYHWGRPYGARDTVGFAVNSRMAYVYILNPRVPYAQIVNRLIKEQRIDVIAWSLGNAACVTNPGLKSCLKFTKGGGMTDEYGQHWSLKGDRRLLDLGGKGAQYVHFGRYPDVLQQLWSALHSHEGRYIIVTAKKGYQFGDEQAPLHDGGAQQASLLKEDVMAPLIVAGFTPPSNHIRKIRRFIDLKPYFLSLVRSQDQ